MGRRVVRLDVRGVRDQTDSRDRLVDMDTGLTHAVAHTPTRTVDLKGGG